jgi:hypothetical protein
MWAPGTRFLGLPPNDDPTPHPIHRDNAGAVSIVRIGRINGGSCGHRWLGLKPRQKILDGGSGDVPTEQNRQDQMINRKLGMKFEHTLGYGGAGAEEDPPLECC